MNGILLSEAYYGKNDLLIEMENLLGGISDKVKSNSTYNVMKYERKVISKIESIICTLFNFEKATVYISSDSVLREMYTTPTTLNLSDKNFDTVRGKYGIEFKESKNKRFLIYTNNAFIGSVSKEHIVAGILHEIGHNFYHLNRFKHEDLPEIEKAYKSAIKEFEIVDDEEKLSAQYEIEVDKSRYFDNIITSKWVTKNFFLNLALTTVLSPFLVFINLYQLLNMNLGRYKEEKFSDNFATSYGYGSEMSDLSAIFENIQPDKRMQQLYEKSAYMRIIMDLDRMVGEIYDFLDEHPKKTTRIKDQIRKLKWELKNNDELDEKSIAEINTTINNIERIYDRMISDKSLLMKLQYMFSRLLMRSGNFRELFARTRDYNFDGIMKN
jgi:hypothetical protein